MALQDEIARIKQAKVDIKSSLANKGIDVGDGKIDTYSSAIDNADIGGGTTSKPNIYKVETIEEKDAITDMIENDMCVVHKTILEKYDGNVQIKKIHLPDSFTLGSAVTTSITINFKSETSTTALFKIVVSATSVKYQSLSGFLPKTFISYSSTDGINYTKDSKYANVVEYEFNVLLEKSADFDENLYDFIILKKVEFGGMFTYLGGSWKNSDINIELSPVDLMDGYTAYANDGIINGSMITLANQTQLRNLTTKFSKIDTSAVTSFNMAFSDDRDVRMIPFLDFTNATDIAYMMSQREVENEEIYLSNVDFKTCTTFNKFVQKSFKIKKLVFDESVKVTHGKKFAYFADECTALEYIKMPNITTAVLTDFNYMFNNCENLVEIDMSQIYGDLQSETDAYSLDSTFANCSKLQKIDARNMNFTNAVLNGDTTFTNVPTDCLIIVKDTDNKNWFNTNFPSMTNIKTVDELCGGDLEEYLETTIITPNNFFNEQFIVKYPPIKIEGTSLKRAFDGYSIAKLPELDTSNVTDMEGMFAYYTGATTVPLYDTSNVTNMRIMFGNSSITTIPLFNTSKVENMEQMFQYTKIKTIPLLDTSNVTKMNNIFAYCGQLNEVPLLNTSNVTNMTYAFKSCTQLLSIPLFNTSNVKSMYGMFSSCSKLKSIPAIDTSNVTTMGLMFDSCSALEEVPELDCSNVTSLEAMFSGTKNYFTTFGGLKDIGKAFLTDKAENYQSYRIDFKYSTKLTHDSLMNIINKLYDIKSKGCQPQQLILGSTNLAKLTAEEIAIATNKGWSVS